MGDDYDHILMKPLTDAHIDKNETATYIKNMLYQQLPRSDRQDIDKDMKWSFKLGKRTEKQHKKGPRKRKTFLSRKERKKLDLLKLSKDNWNYDSLQNMRDMWKQYMRENLEIVKVPNFTEPDYQTINVLLAKSEYIGAKIEIIRSTCPSVVGINGTIVLETKNTFQLVTKESKLKIILKENCVFELRLDNIKFTIFGKLLVTRPAERSVKKIKLLFNPDL